MTSPRQAQGSGNPVFDRIAANPRNWEILIAHGHYVGKAKPTGKPVRAAFAHFWSFDGERFTGVRQVTDSAIWEHALDP